MAQVVDPLEVARGATGRQRWREAYGAYSQVDQHELTPVDLQSFADSAWLTGRLDEAIRLREAAYAGYSSGGEKLKAARLALILSDDYFSRGRFSIAQGWFATGERLLQSEPESGEHALLALVRGSIKMFAEGNLPEAIAAFERATEIGERHGERDTQLLALAAKGRALIKSGEIEGGLALLDEASAGAVGGALGTYSTGLIYCLTISSCNDLGDYRRASEWTEAANRWCDQLEVTGFPGACRVHRAEIMRLRGDLHEAEQVAVAACEELHDFERFITAAGYYEIGEIRRRLGDFAAAEDAYRKASELGSDPQPGLSLLRLAEGKRAAAVAGITRTLQETEDALSRIRRLPAQVDIAIAAGDLKTARAAAAELERLVDAYKIGGRRTPAFDATIDFAGGQIALAEGDAKHAAELFRRSRDGWKQVGAPYETAQARTRLGISFRREGDEHAATAELEAALSAFERLGAKLDEQRVKELLGREQARRTFVFTDIVDSTRLLTTLGNEKWRKLLARHNELLRERIVERGGEVVQQTGDGFFAAFVDARSAIDAAIEIQRALDAEIVAPDVRIGAHCGGAIESDGEFNHYGGDAVHLAARIGATAGAGEILVSRDTLDGMSERFRVSEPRAETFKGFEDPVEVVLVDWR
ncbi:MAG: adenylate/guanylate cyclase domain-containing protein [Gaiellaceae bacterium]